MSLDLMVMCGYFMLTLLLGLWAGKGVKTIEDFSTGGRNYGSFFIFATLSSSFIGGGFTTGLAEKSSPWDLFMCLPCGDSASKKSWLPKSWPHV